MITITHPFSPHKGKEYFVVEEAFGWDKDAILCSDSEGNSRVFPKSWTDYPADEPVNPFEGAVDFWYDDLQMLARLIGDTKKV